LKYRRLGKTGLRVSVIGVGTWQFGGEWGKVFTQGEANRIIERAGELGINLLDTAECYGDHLAETLIGRAIRGRRQSWLIATKFGHRFHGNFERTQHYSAAEVRAQLEASLRALETEYVDLYQFHSGSNEAFDQPELWAMLQDQVRLGKIRHVGLSVSPNDNIHQVSQASNAGIATVQVVYNRLDQQPEEVVLPSCIVQDLGVLARVPLASGLLTGKYRPGTEFTSPDDVRSLRDKEEIRERLEAVERIASKEVPPGVPMAAWALAWCLHHPAVTCAIPGCKTVEQVELNAEAADLEMVSPEHRLAVDRA
jgi:aryl-alcohol dehydrogenase-like predicted oxidoreductase